jgi:hypothetical protein
MGATERFCRVSIREYDTENYEGAGHGGLSALIDVVGLK